MRTSEKARHARECEEHFHALYEKHGTYAEVARRTGFSASTIRRYVGMGMMPNAHKMAVTQTITVGRK